MNAAEFNALHPVGTHVFAYPGCRPEGDSSAPRLVTRTRTAAQTSASGDPVVWVEGEGAYITLTHVDPVAQDEWEAARAATLVQAPVDPEPQLTPERLAEIRDLVRYESSIAFYSHRAKESILLLIASAEALLALDLGDLDSRVSATCEDPEHPTWLRKSDDKRGCPWCRVAELEAERHSTNEALDDAVQELRARQSGDVDRAAVLDDFISRCEVALGGCCSECDAAIAIVKGRKQAALDGAPVPELQRLSGDELRAALRGNLFGGGAR